MAFRPSWTALASTRHCCGRHWPVTKVSPDCQPSSGRRMRLMRSHGPMAKLMIPLLAVALVAACSASNTGLHNGTSAAGTPAPSRAVTAPPPRVSSPPPALPTAVSCPSKAPAGHDKAWETAYTVGCGAAMSRSGSTAGFTQS